ncbi:hypothetical protein Dimus_036047, partial [Dionaea muscipula]
EQTDMNPPSDMNEIRENSAMDLRPESVEDYRFRSPSDFLIVSNRCCDSSGRTNPRPFREIVSEFFLRGSKEEKKRNLIGVRAQASNNFRGNPRSLLLSVPSSASPPHRHEERAEPGANGGANGGAGIDTGGSGEPTGDARQDSETPATTSESSFFEVVSIYKLYTVYKNHQQSAALAMGNKAPLCITMPKIEWRLIYTKSADRSGGDIPNTYDRHSCINTSQNPKRK